LFWHVLHSTKRIFDQAPSRNKNSHKIRQTAREPALTPYAKKEGVEIIPNSYFWLALPGLIKDGHVYVYRKVMHLFGRGHYEEM